MNKKLVTRATKRFSPTALLSICFAIVLAVIMRSFIEEQVTQDLTNENEHIIEMLCEHVDNKLAGIKSDLDFMKLSIESKLSTIDNDKPELAQLLLNYAISTQKYDQIRLINTKGNEIIRVNKTENCFKLVSENRLQNKKYRYYFEELSKISNEEIYISNFDLNVENGKIEIPLKPMIRFGIKITENKNNETAYLLVNFSGNILLNNIHKEKKLINGELYLTNQNGHFLHHPNNNLEWGFMFKNKKDSNLLHLEPHLQTIFQAKEEKIYTKSDGDQYYKHTININKILKNKNSDSSKSYIFINHIPKKLIKEACSNRVWLWYRFIFFACIIILATTWLLNYYNQLKIKAKKDLNENYNRLLTANKSIKEHKEELKSSNESLLEALQSKELAEKEAQKHVKQLKEVFHNLPIGICITNQDNSIKYLNPYLIKIIHSEEFILIDENFDNHFNTAPNGKKNGSEFEMIFKSNQTSTPLLTTRLILSTDTNDQSTAYFFQDITKLKKTEESLSKALQQEKEINNIKSNLVTNVSHEFRTPLSIMLSSCELIMNHYDKLSPEDINAECTSIVNEIDKMEEIIDNILYITKVNKPTEDEIFQEVDVVNFTKGIISNLSSVQRNLIKLHLHSYQKEIIAKIDTSGLYTILINLLNNALKYSSESDPINLILSEKNDVLCIECIDKGIGIPKEDQKHLFELFHRGQNTKSIKGSGLGLAMVKRTVSNMHGKISFKSKENTGTHFTIKLPLSHVKESVL